MATLALEFVILSNASPAVVLANDVLTGAAAPTVIITKKAFADGTITLVVNAASLTYDQYTKTWGYLLADATPTTHRYIGMATTTYATASPASVHALGIVIPDELISTRGTLTAQQVWEYATRTLSSFGTLAADVWAVAVRTLTAIADSAGVTTLLTRVPSTVPTAAQIDTQLSGTHGSGAWGASTGATSKVYTVTAGGAPKAGVYCRMTTDAAGTNQVDAGTTNALGQVTFHHDLPVGTTVYIWRALAGYEATDPDTEVTT